MTVSIEEWDDLASNQQQQYLTHAAFRYFGKVPPTVTARILMATSPSAKATCRGKKRRSSSPDHVKAGRTRAHDFAITLTIEEWLEENS